MQTVSIIRLYAIWLTLRLIALQNTIYNIIKQQHATTRQKSKAKQNNLECNKTAKALKLLIQIVQKQKHTHTKR